LREIGCLYTSPGFCTESLTLFLATDLSASPLPQDDDENVRTSEVPYEEIPALLAGGASAVISPLLFRGVCVRVQSEDPREVQHVSRALRLVGAIVRSSGDESVEIVVSPHRILSRSRGSQLLLSVLPAPRLVRNVLISQIPWVPSVLRAHEDLHKTEQANRIVVADARGRVQPAFLDMPDLPRLHFEAVPRGYVYSPFDPVLDSWEALAATYKDRIAQPPAVAPGPPDRGHCDLCEVMYVAAELHRQSADHQAKCADGRWDKFEVLAKLLGNVG
jgi:hypothetical protein